jgi:AcrR family transcriptional regulator
MVSSPSPLLSELPDARQSALLTAAVGVFARFGFRKTSMDEVARAAGVSRQGLYLQFSNKEELFRRALQHSLNQQLAAAVAALRQSGSDLPARLTAACDAWSGRSLGLWGPDAADLMCASSTLAGATLAEYENAFEKALAQAIAASPLAAHCAGDSVCPHDVARALHATARGLKQRCRSSDEFMKTLTAAIRMYCAPLAPRLVEKRGS